ncbi:MAG: ImmA/IrrE family metallo-endopeptidase [Gemmatimonadetes bacterium]|nr:ImmA/IrrE family metallo-endopeptidase [Gemmatimonadota bacterium]MYB56937.1 ImmA/IrrE family metallo-endopeptidase [Gemmatimonadota bacterium]
MSLRQSIAVHAAQLRENMAISDSEVIGDIVDQIQESGYRYMEGSFGDEFSGYSQSLGGGNFLIGFNRDHFWSDKFHRFTLSHELGHITIPEHRKILETEELHRSKSEFQSRDQIEREADYFAICFLAPKKAFQTAMKYKEYIKDTILGLSEHFGISSYAAVLRFIELTDLTCTLVVCNEAGLIEYERRSDRMKETYKQDFLRKKQVKGTTLTYDYMDGHQEEDTCTVSLNDWFDDLPIEIEATESVIELGYNGKFLTLLTPHIPDLDEFIAENESIGF